MAQDNHKKNHDNNEETLDSLLSDEDSQRLSNPYVAVCGIENYSQSKPDGIWPNLAGVGVDVQSMASLWKTVYNYKNVCIAFESSDEKGQETQNNQISNTNAMTNEQDFHDFLVDIRVQIDSKKCNDGLIFYYSGHGAKDAIILQDGDKYKIPNIIEVFNGKNCIFLRNKPKIMIFDCCRGLQFAQSYEFKSNNNQDGKTATLKGPKNPKNSWINREYHANSGLAIIYGNPINYSIADSDYGGCLTRSICKLFEKPKDISKYSLRDLIIAIRRQTKIYSGHGIAPTQLVDFNDTLEYKVYFDSNSNTNDTNDTTESKQQEQKQKQQQKYQKAKAGLNYSGKCANNKCLMYKQLVLCHRGFGEKIDPFDEIIEQEIKCPSCKNTFELQEYLLYQCHCKIVSKKKGSDKKTELHNATKENVVRLASNQVGGNVDAEYQYLKFYVYKSPQTQ